MLHYSICPLLKVKDPIQLENQFYLLVYYYLSHPLFHLFRILTNLRIYFQITQESLIQFWLIISYLQRSRDYSGSRTTQKQTHFIFSPQFKRQFLSFIEHNIGSKNTILIYFIREYLLLYFKPYLVNKFGYINIIDYFQVCNSFHIGAIGYTLYLQLQMLCTYPILSTRKVLSIIIIRNLFLIFK
ncbi:unnamed protein product (macronuclear) [Paramecium tetraurelia]|uniref:Transmembrane protein n=1 Tax=Paramecium tetraurelia TaxID=5888 RepID=A0E0B2_PARTE|nr:uncharacterized protein GSPATT00021897001 [Paramecium tetraurelia]CAK88729.1 unnamed protein product [Paramecium tetraurelia]|eukprot:XP_001456126.1 hypothetical protein (macronuclear) [Paramecium tetraurelia strain d4-2]